MDVPKDIDNPPFPGKLHMTRLNIDQKKLVKLMTDLDVYSKEIQLKEEPRGRFTKKTVKLKNGASQTFGCLEANPTALVGVAARLLHTAVSAYGYYAFDEYTGILDENTERFGVVLLSNQKSTTTSRKQSQSMKKKK